MYHAQDEREEAWYTATVIQREVESGARKYGDYAILYRINAQSRVYEDAFMKTGVPYKIIGGHKFYDRKEIKDIIAYLRTIHNPHDDISLKRIINVPKRGIGKTTIDKAESLAMSRDVSIYSILLEAHGISELSRASQKLKSFVDKLARLRTIAPYTELTEWIKTVIDETGIVQELELEGTEGPRAGLKTSESFNRLPWSLSGPVKRRIPLLKIFWHKFLLLRIQITLIRT